MTPRETELTAQVAALEAEIVRLREALSYFVQFNSSEQSIEVFLDTCEITKARKALSTPFTPTALNELIEKVEKMTIERCAVITGWSIIDMPTTVEISTVRKYSKAIRALPTGQINIGELT